MKRCRLTGVFFLFAATIWSQTAEPGGESTRPVIRVDVNLRQVDLIVTDAKGKHVSDLEASDFELLEDGKPQRLTNFSWVEVTPPPSGARLAALNEKPSLLERLIGTPRFRKTPGNDILSAPARNLRKEEIRRMIAIVAEGKPAPSNIVTIMDRVRKFVDEQVGPGDMVSIRSTLHLMIPMRGRPTVQLRDSMGIFQQFTNDKRQLDAATERLPRVCMGFGICAPDVPGAMMAAIRDLQDLPGRKALLFVGRYRGPVESIVAMANRAGVVIYVLDPEGLQMGSPIGDNGELKEASLKGAVSPASARLLAERTGGRRIMSTVGFDLTRAFNEVIEDLSGYYLLGYHTAGDEPRLASKTPVYHKIEVKVLRPGLTVRVRDGRMGAPEPVAQPASNPATQPPGREQILTKALFSIFTQDGLRVRLNPLYAASPPDRKHKRTPFILAALKIDGRDVSFAEADGGKMKAVVDIVLAVFNQDGSQAGAANRQFTLNLSKEGVARMIKSGAQFTLQLPVAKPGPYQVRAAVRDAASGELGSAYAFLEVPDFNQQRISLSSLVLTLPEGAQAAPTVRPDWNEFEPGATVQYFCEAFGLKTPGKPPAAPNVEAGVKLYRGGSPVAEIPPSPVTIEKAGDQLILTGQMRIPDDLPPGNYAMELLAYDRQEPSAKKQTALQWIDVTVVDRGK